MIQQDMRNAALQLEKLNPEILNYISELETFKQKYLDLKEQYDALMYKKYVRSAEDFANDKQ